MKKPQKLTDNDKVNRLAAVYDLVKDKSQVVSFRVTLEQFADMQEGKSIQTKYKGRILKVSMAA